MLGPIAGGLIVGYLQWRFIFFVNIPIGLVGLYMVYRHVPDYREHTDPLDVTGLILFGSGVALLSYVLEVFGEHTLSALEVLGLLARLHCSAGGLRVSCDENRASSVAPDAVSNSHVSRGGGRQLCDSPGDRRNSVSFSATVSGRPGIHADSIRAAA